jgi:hypothetical protein
MNFPIIDSKQFEGLGDGFGMHSAQNVSELNKALSAGYASDPASQSNGGSLRVESLDATLKVVSFMMRNIVMYNDIPKSKAYNTVEEYNLLSKYGGKGGFFIDEGGLPKTEDSSYQRKVQYVKFMGTTREITHPMLLVKPAHGNVVSLETKNGAMWMLQRMEENLFKGNSSIIAQSFDGLEKQLLDGYADADTAGDGKPDVSEEHILDLRGKPLSEGIFEECARILMDNYMYPTHCYLNHSNHTDFNKGFFSKGRYGIPVGGDSTVGFNADKVKTSAGVVQLRPNVFLRINQSAPSVADNASAPTKPVGVTITVQAKSTSRGFKADEYATYAYEVTAISKSGESESTVGNASAVVADVSSDEVVISIDRGAVSGNDLTQGYRIYRTRIEDGAAGPKYLIKEIASAGSNTVYLDGNEELPGLGRAYIGQLDESVLTLRELSPMLKFPLATIASSIRWMQLYYNTPIIFRPRGWVIIKNVGRLKESGLSL